MKPTSAPFLSFLLLACLAFSPFSYGSEIREPTSDEVTASTAHFDDIDVSLFDLLAPAEDLEVKPIVAYDPHVHDADSVAARPIHYVYDRVTRYRVVV